MIQLSTLTENPKNARAISDEHFAANPETKGESC